MRRPYIDWLRGIAVLIMIEWHTIDAWTADGERTGEVFKALAFLGGWAAPMFLFLAGVAIPLAANAQMARGASVREASWALQRRGWQVFLYAHLFRLQSWIFNPYAVWHSIFKPDILNILGLGMVAVAWAWGRSSAVVRRYAWLLLPAAGILILAPLSRGWEWPSLLHGRLEAYIRPAGSFGVFTLFPWTGFLFVGAAVGTWIGTSRPAAEERRFHGWLAAAGAAALVAGWIGMYLPSPFERSSFWTTSVSFFLMRTGIMTLGLVVAWLWMQRPSANRWSPTLVLGRTSLFVYWVHIELAYGVASAPIKRALPVEWAVVAYVVFTAGMVWLAGWWNRRLAAGPWIPPHLVAHVSAPSGRL